MRPWPRLLIILATVVVFGWALNSVYGDVKQKTIADLNKQQMTMAKQAALGIENFFKHYRRSLTYLSRDEAVIFMTESGRRELQSFYEFNTPEVKAISRVGPAGRILYTVPYNKNAINADISKQAHVQRIMSTHEPVVSDVFEAVQGYKAVAYHVPVFEGNEFRGTLAILIPFEHLAGKYLEQVKVGKSGYAWVLSEKGIELFGPDRDNLGRSIFESAKDFPQVLAMAGEMVEGHGGAMFFDYTMTGAEPGKPDRFQAAYYPIELGGTFWSIAVATPEKEILAAIKGFRNKLIGIIALLMTASLVYIFYFVKARSVVREQIKRQAAEQALRDSEEKYRILFEYSPISLWEEDFSRVKEFFDRLRDSGEEDVAGRLSREPETVEECARMVRVVDVNQHTVDLFEAPSKNHLLGSLDQIFLPESWEQFTAELSALSQGHTAFDAEIVNRTLSGEKKTVRLHLAVAPGHEESLSKVFVSLIDVTAQKKAEQDRQRLEGQIIQAQKVEAVGTLASGIAHDFNNILQAISGYVQLMSSSPGLAEDNLKHLRQIETGTNRAAELVRRLLTFSRKVEPDINPIDLNQTVIQAVSLLERTIPKMISIKTDLADGLRLVDGDATQLEQVLLNLGSNASDAMSESGGRIVIKTRNVTLDEAFCAKHIEARPGDYLHLVVTDNGHGMSKETLKNIYDPFFTTKEIGKGTGLGMAMVYGIVKSHKGYIFTESEVGAGTTFNIFLPAGAAERSAIGLEMGTENENLGGRESILLVDDDAAVLDIAETFLEENGYRTLRADSGERALEIYEKNADKIDLVILDLGMPGMGGFECFRRLLEINPGLKLIIASGYSADDKVKKALETGAGGFMGKPYRLVNLLKKVRELLDKRE